MREMGEQNTHIDDDAVDHFAAAMKDKLAKARAKGRSRWFACDPDDLSAMLRAHVEKGDPLDVANFCCFLWALGKPISAAPVAQEPVARANIYMHKGRRQFLLTELGTKAAGDLGVGAHDLFAAPVAAQGQRHEFDDCGAFPLEGTRPVDRPAPAGQQLVDAWRAEHGDEAFPE